MLSHPLFHRLCCFIRIYDDEDTDLFFALVMVICTFDICDGGIPFFFFYFMLLFHNYDEDTDLFHL